MMKIAILGPGILPIPPVGWGAVEILIHEYRLALEKAGCEVLVVNTQDRAEIVAKVAAFQPDFVHCQYDELIDVMGDIDCPAKAITSHFGYLDQVWNYKDYLTKVHRMIVSAKDVLIFALSPSIAEQYRQDGVAGDRLFVMPNGVSQDLFRIADKPAHGDRSLYLAKVDYRKRQGKFQAYDCGIDFAGNLCPHTAIASGFDASRSDYLGEWNKQDVYEKMTDYANLVLLSDGEAHPLVCLEAMAAGLGLVISSHASANLDLTKPFIDVIPDDRIDVQSFVRDVILKNRAKSLACRDAIQAYAATFSWDATVQKYLRTVQGIVTNRKEKSVRPLLSVKPRLAVVTVATGKYYDLFFKDFAKSVQEKLAPDHEITLHCFTDCKEAPSAATEYHSARHMGWPFDTLLRFHLMARILDKLMTYDFVLYLDVDMIALEAIEPRFFDADLIGVQHPGFFRYPSAASFEADPDESAYVPPEKRKQYIQGCLWGGKPFAFKELILTLKRKIDADLSRGVIPVWHDESYLNWFLADHAFTALPPAYAYPEGMNFPFAPAIVHRLKNHDAVRGTEPALALPDKVIDGMTLPEQAALYRMLYLRAHQKNQSLEREWSRLNQRVRSVGAMGAQPDKIIDVIVPLYNNENYAVEAVNSALCQTYPVRKIIVVDDGSTDRSADILEKCYKDDPRVTVLRVAHQGLPAARNRGLEKSDAEYIAFLDSDDVWYEDKLERQMGVFAIRPDIGLVYCSHDDIDDEGNPLAAPHRLVPNLRGNVHQRVLSGNVVSGGSAALVKRTCLLEAGPFDESLSYAEDWDMWLRLAKRFSFDYVGDSLLAIRRHSAQMSAHACYAQRMNRIVQHLRIWSKWPQEARHNPDVVLAIRGWFLGPSLAEGLSMKRRLAILSVMKKRIGIHIHPILFKAACRNNLYMHARIGYKAAKQTVRRFVGAGRIAGVKRRLGGARRKLLSYRSLSEQPISQKGGTA